MVKLDNWIIALFVDFASEKGCIIPIVVKIKLIS